MYIVTRDRVFQCTGPSIESIVFTVATATPNALLLLYGKSKHFGVLKKFFDAGEKHGEIP